MSLERALLEYLMTPCVEPFDLKTVPISAAPTVEHNNIANEGMIITSKQNVSLRDIF